MLLLLVTMVVWVVVVALVVVTVKQYAAMSNKICICSLFFAVRNLIQSANVIAGKQSALDFEVSRMEGSHKHERARARTQ